MIPLGVLASAHVAPAGGGSLTYVGRYVSGETVTLPGPGSLILSFAWVNASLRTLTSVTIAGAAATRDGGDDGGRRAGVAVYRADVSGSASVAWAFSAGTAHLVAAYYYPGALTVAGSAVVSPTAADGLWSLSVPAAVGGILINSAAVAYGGTTAVTLGTGNDDSLLDAGAHRCSHGHGVTAATPHTVTATISPAQANPNYNYTRLLGVTYQPA